ncbi:hypothetical protein [Massilia cavernae]|uniref:hypothetical protein n=1 Tax=Massilia cavernae TaxID=2320864 RepID=UPI001C71D13F|nr:hypothetical protein [Massilia cavernae]
MAEFLDIDPDLVTAAAAGSQEVEDYWRDDDSVEVWMTELSRNETRIVFDLLLQGASQQAERRVKSEYLAWLKASGSRESSPAKPRKVAELRALAEQAERRRLEGEAKERARQEAEQRKQREARLLMLAADFDRHWKVVDRQAERGTASGYDEAKRALVDLAAAYALVSSRNVFDQALRRFMVSHGKRSSLVRRLVEAGLWQK